MRGSRCWQVPSLRRVPPVGAGQENATTHTNMCARIRGRVQDVGYRDACVQAAQAVGVTGWVRNRQDGSVEVQIRGSVDQLLAMRRWLAEGPPLAEVRNIAWEPVATESVAAAVAGDATFERRPTA